MTARSGVTDRCEIATCFLAEDSVGAAQLRGDTALFDIDDFCDIEDRTCCLAEDSVGAVQLRRDTALFEIDDLCGVDDPFICKCFASLPVLSAASTSASDTGLGLTMELACCLVTGSAIDAVREHNVESSGEGESKRGKALSSTVSSSTSATGCRFCRHASNLGISASDAP